MMRDLFDPPPQPTTVLSVVTKRAIDSPIKKANLARECKISPRAAEAEVNRLRSTAGGGHPIGSLTKPPYGYYYAKGEVQIQQVFDYLMARIISQLHTAYSIKKSQRVAEALGQLGADL